MIRYVLPIATTLLLGIAALFFAMWLLDVEAYKPFLAYFVLLPLANVCFAIAIGLATWFLISHR